MACTTFPSDKQISINSSTELPSLNYNIKLSFKSKESLYKRLLPSLLQSLCSSCVRFLASCINIYAVSQRLDTFNEKMFFSFGSH